VYAIEREAKSARKSVKPYKQVCDDNSSNQVEDKPLSLLEELKPRAKKRIMDLVSAAGIDVSDWANYVGGQKRAASNPKYCYEWSFVEPGRTVVLNLWHDSMRERKGTVSINLNLRKSARRYSQRGGKGVWRARAEKLDLAIQEAAKNLLPIRVVVNDGQMRDSNDLNAKASRVEYRLLDPLPWAVTSYDWKTGECTLTRGALRGRFVDQFTVQPDSEVAVERRMVSGMAYVRNPAVRYRVLERAKGVCEYCEKLGFMMADGNIFLETHHVVPLGEGGTDTEDNVAAVCANHHREAHHGARAAEIRQALLSRLRQLLPQS
jgi:5-methylcytosine-specific restriction protein A